MRRALARPREHGGCAYPAMAVHHAIHVFALVVGAIGVGVAPATVHAALAPLALVSVARPLGVLAPHTDSPAVELRAHILTGIPRPVGPRLASEAFLFVPIPLAMVFAAFGVYADSEAVPLVILPLAVVAPSIQ